MNFYYLSQCLCLLLWQGVTYLADNSAHSFFSPRIKGHFCVIHSLCLYSFLITLSSQHVTLRVIRLPPARGVTRPVSAGTSSNALMTFTMIRMDALWWLLLFYFLKYLTSVLVLLLLWPVNSLRGINDADHIIFISRISEVPLYCRPTKSKVSNYNRCTFIWIYCYIL